LSVAPERFGFSKVIVIHVLYTHPLVTIAHVSVVPVNNHVGTQKAKSLISPIKSNSHIEFSSKIQLL
jgi:hypothetical protein